eukprot:TRINITY_DN65915_c4_g1_i1.p1 TRINITY_DN65915_c4_g1~~TRINITY_DN65915_c4_g1_i1.p1  ORF type:complete len:679 (+),score=323.55 TRINITY_DN65915_c4_g1_i1:55-2091(+)
MKKHDEAGDGRKALDDGLEFEEDMESRRAKMNEEFQDLSSRAQVFREKLVEEFHLAERTTTAPKYNTSDLFSASEPVLFRQVLLHTPNQLINFKIFKRSQDVVEAPTKGDTDKRLTRVRNINSIPIGVWAHWLSTHSWFTGFIFALILSNAVLQGLQTQIGEEEHRDAYIIMDLYDDITIMVFVLEIVIKWIDSFKEFWWDGWNVFDFVITVLSAIPAIMRYAVNSDSDSFKSVSNQLRLFRSLRILKMIARLSSLRVVISTVMEAFQSLGFVLLLLLMLTYIFGIFAVNLFYPYTISDIPSLKFQDKFRDLPQAFISLFQLLTLDQWYAIQEDIQRVVEPVIVITFFIFWVWIGAFIFRNVFVGVMVRKFDEMTRQVEEAKKHNKHRRQGRKRLQILNNVLRQSRSNAASHASLARSRSRIAASQSTVYRAADGHGRRAAASSGTMAGIKSFRSVRSVAQSEASAHDIVGPQGSRKNALDQATASSVLHNRTTTSTATAAPTNSEVTRNTMHNANAGQVKSSTAQPKSGNLDIVAELVQREELDRALQERDEKHAMQTNEAQSFANTTKTNLTTTTTANVEELQQAAQREQQARGDGDERDHATRVRDEQQEMDRWHNLVQRTLMALSMNRQPESVWPRHTLFRYLRTMERLQNNLREYQELQYLTAFAVHQLNDTA